MTIPSMAWMAAGVSSLIANPLLVAPIASLSPSAINIATQPAPQTPSQNLLGSPAVPPTDHLWRCPNALAQALPTPNTAQFPIRFQGCNVGYVSDALQAREISARLDLDHQNPSVDWQAVQPKRIGQAIVLHRGNVPLFTLEPAIAKQFAAHSDELAIDWTNRIRTLAGQPSLSLADAQKQLYDVTETAAVTAGSASWYGPYFHGRQTANGEIYNQQDLTAAHRTLPLGSYVKVTHRRNGKSVIVRINDRGPYYDEDQRIIDLSKRAAQLLGGEDQGVMPIELVELRSTPKLPASTSLQTIAFNPVSL